MMQATLPAQGLRPVLTPSRLALDAAQAMPHDQPLVAHYAALARRPGWYAYVRQQVRSLDAHPSGAFAGLHRTVASTLVGFVPVAGEASTWWLVSNEAERGWPSFVSRVPAPVAVVAKGRK